MFKRLLVLVAVVFSVSFAVSSVGYAFTLLTKEQALEEVFGKDAEITVETKVLEGQRLTNVMERLGGKLVWYQQGSVSAIVEAMKKIDFYFASKGGKRFGVAIIEVEPGKWGPITFITAMTLQGAVKKVRVLAYIEKRGRPIARRSFMNQYRGKTTKSVLTVGKDITGISGATISSRAATFTVKKALILYEEFYLKK
jgi:Na+-translocating ferredoxin:NAD+ oxidoreductase RnfG subunit